MLQRPGAVEDAREIMKRLLAKRNSSFNATVEKIRGLDPDAEDADPFVRLLQDPGSLGDQMSDPDRARELASTLNSSALFEELRQLGSEVMEQMRIQKLDAG